MEQDEDRAAEALVRAPFGSGRLGTYTLLGGMTGVMPVPWVPAVIVRRVRGALVHDLVSRHGLSLTPEARDVLVSAGGPEGTTTSYVKQGVGFALGRVLGRFGPLALVGPVQRGLTTFVLGHLLERYLTKARKARSVRIDVDEARTLRRAIDQALVYALTTDGKAAPEDRPMGAEDLRDATTRFVDGLLVGAASVPGWLVRRLDAAFDDTLTTTHG